MNINVKISNSGSTANVGQQMNDDGLSLMTTGKSPLVFEAPIDLFETPSEFFVIVDLPGAAHEGIDVTIEEGHLYISAPVEPRNLYVENTPVLVQEYGVGHFSRKIRLGGDLQTSGITAQFCDGILAIRLLKQQVGSHQSEAVNVQVA
ncbi:MAG: Hsp20/alpha crystallin family protein [Phycisphaerales bacterium]|jgi:HSP20 family molecular chaperone IbpA|nr:Hsp20/alpha crystallin family protein [Phycisphaerales bacterium]